MPKLDENGRDLEMENWVVGPVSDIPKLLPGQDALNRRVAALASKTPQQYAAALKAVDNLDKAAFDHILYSGKWKDVTPLTAEKHAHYAGLIDLIKNPDAKAQAYAFLQENDTDAVENLLKETD